MTHSDDDGLVLPPKIAPVQVVIMPIITGDENQVQLLEVAENLRSELSHRLDPLQIKVDGRDNLRPAEKFFHWIQQGVPVRVEIGPKDLQKSAVMVARRDLRDKQSVPLAGVSDHVIQLLDTIQTDMFERARSYRDEQTRTAKSYDEFKQILESAGGFIRAHWNGSADVEEQIKTETKATIRCIPFTDNLEPGVCIVSGEPSTQEVLFGIAY